MLKKHLVLLTFLVMAATQLAATASVRIETRLSAHCPEQMLVLGMRSFVPRIGPGPTLSTLAASAESGLNFVYAGYQAEWKVSDQVITEAREQDKRYQPTHRLDIDYRDNDGRRQGFMRLVSTTPFAVGADDSRQRLPFFLWYQDEPNVAKGEGRYPRAVEVIRSYTEPSLGRTGRFRVMMLMFRAALGALSYFGKLDHTLVSSSMAHNVSIYEMIGLQADPHLALPQHSRWFQQRAASDLLRLYAAEVSHALYTDESASVFQGLSPILARSHPEILFWKGGDRGDRNLDQLVGSGADATLLAFQRMHREIAQSFDYKSGAGDAEAALAALRSPHAIKAYGTETLDPETHHEIRRYTIAMICAVAGKLEEAATEKRQIEALESSSGWNTAPLNWLGHFRVETLDQEFGPVADTRSQESLVAELATLEELKPIYPYWIAAPIHQRRAQLLFALGKTAEATQAANLSAVFGP